MDVMITHVETSWQLWGLSWCHIAVIEVTIHTSYHSSINNCRSTVSSGRQPVLVSPRIPRQSLRTWLGRPVCRVWHQRWSGTDMDGTLSERWTMSSHWSGTQWRRQAIDRLAAGRRVWVQLSSRIQWTPLRTGGWRMSVFTLPQR